MTRLYVVMAMETDYAFADQDGWPVEAFTDEAKAKDFVDKWQASKDAYQKLLDEATTKAADESAKLKYDDKKYKGNKGLWLDAKDRIHIDITQKVYDQEASFLGPRYPRNEGDTIGRFARKMFIVNINVSE